MSIRELLPGDRGGEATRDVAAILAGITLPPIEPFGSDVPSLIGLPRYIPAPVPDPEPPSVAGIAREVYDAGILALGALKVLEDAVSACKVSLVARVAGAAHVEAKAVALDSWQSGVMQASALTHMAMALGIPERTAAALEYHSTVMVQSHPNILAGISRGDLSFRHGATMVDEFATLRENGAIGAEAISDFEANLLRLARNTTVTAFMVKARRAREKTFPESMITRTKEAFQKRALTCNPGKDGMSWLTLHVPTVSAEGIYTHCTRLARAIKGEANAAKREADRRGKGEDCREYRSIAQLRADIAAILLLGQNSDQTIRNVGQCWDGNGTSTRTSTAPDAADSTAAPAAAGSLARTRGVPAGTVLVGIEPPWAHASPAEVSTAIEPEPMAEPDPHVGEEPLVGELVGDDSGYVDGVVDGISEHPNAEYEEQLEALRHYKTITEPPLPKALVLLMVPVLGLLGITDEPAELAGPGGSPVPESIARKLLANSSTFLRVLTDPVSGEPLPAEPKRYTLKESERAVLQALAGHCYVPNCPNPVIDTDVDHLEAFEFGGESSMANLRPACKRHHAMKHFKDDKNRYGERRCIKEPERKSIRLRGWTPRATDDGRIGWITPSGRYQPPPDEDPQRPRYPKWLMKLITKQRRTGL